MKKAPWTSLLGAFFVFVLSQLASAENRLVPAETCPPPAAYQVARLDYVYDGDSLRLADGRRVRLIGANAPELAREGRPAEALAEEARQAAVDFWRGEKQVLLVPGAERRDRYGRLLAYVYKPQGRSLEAHLLSRGLAFHIAIPPNLSLAECLHRIENRARSQGLGVWGHPAWQPVPMGQLQAGDSGFRLLRGRVLSVSKNKYFWLQMDAPLVLRIAPKDLGYLKPLDVTGLSGKTIEVRGWLINRLNQGVGKPSDRAPWLLNVRTFYDLNVRKEYKRGGFGS